MHGASLRATLWMAAEAKIQAVSHAWEAADTCFYAYLALLLFSARGSQRSVVLKSSFTAVRIQHSFLLLLLD